MILNIVNVEELVFYDDKIWKNMPELTHLRDQWRISKLSPTLRLTGRRAMAEFLTAARGKYEAVLSNRFGTEVTIDKIDSRVVKNMEFNSSEECINPDGEYSGFAVHREGDRVFMTLWR